MRIEYYFYDDSVIILAVKRCFRIKLIRNLI